MSFLLVRPVALPGGTWSGVFWSLCNVPSDWPHQVSATYFSSLALPGGSFSPSSLLMLGMRLFWICSTSCCNTWNSIFQGFLQTICISLGRWCGSSSKWGSQLGSGGCWCPCWGDFLCIPFIPVLGSQLLCLTGGNEGAQARTDSGPTKGNQPLFYQLWNPSPGTLRFRRKPIAKLKLKN